MRKTLSILRTLLVMTLAAIGPVPGAPTANAALAAALLDRRTRPAAGLVITIPFSFSFPCPGCCKKCPADCFDSVKAGDYFILDYTVTATSNGVLPTPLSGTLTLPYHNGAIPTTCNGPMSGRWNDTDDFTPYNGEILPACNGASAAGLEVNVEFPDDGTGAGGIAESSSQGPFPFPPLDATGTFDLIGAGTWRVRLVAECCPP